MSDGQSEACAWNGPFPGDMPFGIEGELRRERIKAGENDRQSVVAEIREKIHRMEQEAIQRRAGR